MIWRLPWLCVAALVRSLYFLSWVLLPGAIHARVRTMPLCRWGQHDGKVAAWAMMECRRCGKRWPV